ncbi:MAG: hypothetical protein KAR20_07555 [Candidatus Heimdallarchaeota archaeon]|nr:hypothetical protein [Candidatus Heimdallarchaeota archaeon]
MFNYEINPAKNCNSERIATVPNVIPFNNSKVGFLVMKKCTKCGELKSLSNYYNHKHTISGLHSLCKSCMAESCRASRKTKGGVIFDALAGQKKRSKNKDMSIPNYTLEELRQWALNQEIFHKLYKNWVNSGYKKMFKPSFDRINDYNPYTLNNIQITTWQENYDRGNKDRVDGINNKQNKSVIQLTKNGQIINEFYSTCNASRETKINQSNISAACRGIRPMAGGYIWRFII